ncbi:cornifelin homolog B-like [Hypomesus transpacificus]|uniref:cornifelin homolog B-like n=1 Tax=Hypomesus transpacificus TaxID=137520 RepID=UPI001F0746EA|nr:cornifelin homolog B-like [Hypomesus transpacificus]
MTTTKMIIQQPQAFAMATTSNQWSSGICDCTKDMKSCCLAFWCFPCFACITAKEAGECLCLPLLDWFGAIPPATMSLRASLRHRYGIEGTLCNDCLYSVFCLPCTWCQMSREMKTRVQPITLINTRPH